MHCMSTRTFGRSPLRSNDGSFSLRHGDVLNKHSHRLAGPPCLRLQRHRLHHLSGGGGNMESECGASIINGLLYDCNIQYCVDRHWLVTSGKLRKYCLSWFEAPFKQGNNLSHLLEYSLFAICIESHSRYLINYQEA